MTITDRLKQAIDASILHNTTVIVQADGAMAAEALLDLSALSGDCITIESFDDDDNSVANSAIVRGDCDGASWSIRLQS